MKKYPLTWLFVLFAINIFGGLTAWRFVDHFFDDKIRLYNPVFAIYLGISGLLSLIILFRFGDKLWKKEARTRNKNFKNKIKEGKSITLAIKRRIFADFSLIFSVLFNWVFFILLFPSKQFGGIEFTLIRIFGILWFVYGFLFSLVFQKKLIIFKNDGFIVVHSCGQSFVSPSDILYVKLCPSAKFKSGQEFKSLLFASIEIELAEGNKLYCFKADRTLGFIQKIKIIKQIYKTNKCSVLINDRKEQQNAEKSDYTDI